MNMKVIKFRHLLYINNLLYSDLIQWTFLWIHTYHIKMIQSSIVVPQRLLETEFPFLQDDLGKTLYAELLDALDTLQNEKACTG